jgi:hypothetical protein
MYILKRIGNCGGYATKNNYRDNFSKFINPEVTKVFMTIEEAAIYAKDDEVPVYIERLN